MNSSSPHQERITACALLLPWQHTLIVLLILGFLEECTNFHVVSKACRILTTLKLTLEARRIFRGCIHKTIVSLLPTRPRKIARYSKKPEINSIGISSYSECIIITNLSSGPTGWGVLVLGTAGGGDQEHCHPSWGVAWGWVCPVYAEGVEVLVTSMVGGV